MSALFTSWTTRGLTISNRIVVSPMCQYVAEHGKATEWHVIHLGGLASSGARLLLEGTAAEPEGRITPGDLGLSDDVTKSALTSTLNEVRRYSTIPVVLQIAHGGRKASSRVPFPVHVCLAESSVYPNDSYVETTDGYPENKRQGAYRGCSP